MGSTGSETLPATQQTRAVGAVSDPELAVDAALIAAVSLAISLASKRLALMTVLVPALIVARLFAWAWIRRAGARLILGELVFLTLCTGLGAFNDWNSVVNHRIYDYTVPHYVSWSTIPVWMLLFWGMILRFLAALARWHRLDPPPQPSNDVRLGRLVLTHPWLRVAVLLVLVAATRQTIYRFYLDPVLSWLPFALAVVAYEALFGLDRHDRRLAALMLIGGPLIEILYIQVGDLHRYHLGWLGGVPVWIALWWVVAILVWKDLSARIQSILLPAE
ncbi:MAG: hypothetical protein ABI333_02395 [bacterium]